jgi:hypothetical protein
LSVFPKTLSSSAGSKKLFEAQLGSLDEITQEDLDMRRKAYRLIVDYLERHEE